MEVESDILSEVINCNSYHKPAPEYGERAWVAEGDKIDVVYWDEGNGWCLIMHIIPKDCKKCEKIGLDFYRKLKKAIEENYDENGMRTSDLS